MTASIEKIGGTAVFMRSPQRPPTRRERPAITPKRGLWRDDDQWLTQVAIPRWEAEGGALPKT